MYFPSIGGGNFVHLQHYLNNYEIQNKERD